MYKVTIFNHIGKPMVLLPEVPPLAANQWFGIARGTGYYCELEYVGGADHVTNHRIASDQDMEQYSIVGTAFAQMI